MKRDTMALQNMPPPFGYAGGYRDPVSNGYPLGNGYRVYLPHLMRFAAPDSMSPFGRGGINPYAYAEDDPINESDPSGHVPNIVSFFKSIFKSRPEILPVNDASIGAVTAQASPRDIPMAPAPRTDQAGDDPGAIDAKRKSPADTAPPPMKRQRAHTLSRLESLRKEAAWGELADREELDRAIQEIAPNAAPGEYPSSVGVMNEVMKRGHIKLTARFSDTVLNNVKKTTAGEMRHATASMNEVKDLLSEAIVPSAPLSPTSRLVYFGGAILNLAATSSHAQHDFFMHASRSLDEEDKVLMDAYLAATQSI